MQHGADTGLVLLQFGEFRNLQFLIFLPALRPKHSRPPVDLRRRALPGGRAGCPAVLGAALHGSAPLRHRLQGPGVICDGGTRRSGNGLGGAIQC